jgi:hypothetical protein
MRKTAGEKSKYILTPITASSYNRGTKLSNGFSAVQNFSKKATAIFVGFIIAFSGLFIANVQSSQVAHADLISDALCNNLLNGSTYSNYGNGSTFTTPDTSLASVLGSEFVGETLAGEGNKLTAYEKYGTSGTNYTTWKSLTSDSATAQNSDIKFTKWNGGETLTPGKIPTDSGYWSEGIGECTGLSGSIWNGIANVQLTVTELGVTWINMVYFVAFFGSQIVFDGMFNIVEGVVEDLRTSLFIPFIELFIILGALWMFWQGIIKRKSTEAFQGALWMAGAAIAGGILLANPGAIPTASNLVVSTITSAVNETLTGGAQTAANANKELCSVNGNITVTKTEEVATSVSGDTISTEQRNLQQVIPQSARLTQCSIWFNLVYVPWVVGQYGISPTDSSSGEILNQDSSPFAASIVEGIPVTLGDKENPIQNASWPVLQLNSQAMNSDLEASGTNPWQYNQSVGSAIAYSQLVETGNTGWAGRSALDRVNVSSASMVAMVGTGLLVVIFSFEMIALKLAMILLLLLMPIFLLVGVHPGIGRRIAMRWLEFLTNITVKQIILAILLSIFLLMYAIIMGSGIWLAQNILIIGVTILGLSYKGKIMNIFAEVDFGGEKRITDPGKDAADGMKRTMSAVVGAAAGAAAAGMSVNSGAAVSSIGAAGSKGAAAAGQSSPTSDVSPAKAAASSAITSAVKPESKQEASESSVTSPSVMSQDQIQSLRKEAIKKGAIMGAMNGFSSGNLQGAVFGATSTGMMVGDQIGDNAKQASASQYQSSVSEKMLEELTTMRREQINQINNPPQMPPKFINKDGSTIIP